MGKLDNLNVLFKSTVPWFNTKSSLVKSNKPKIFKSNKWFATSTLSINIRGR